MKGKSLSKRLSLLITIGVLGAAGLPAIKSASDRIQIESDSREKLIKAVSTIAADRIAKSLMMHDLYNSQIVLSEVCTSLQVFSCIIEDKTEQILASFPDVVSIEDKKRLKEYSVPIIWAAKPYGKLKIYDNNSEQYAAIIDSILMILPFAGVFALLTFALLVFWVRAPLEEYLSIAENLDKLSNTETIEYLSHKRSSFSETNSLITKLRDKAEKAAALESHNLTLQRMKTFKEVARQVSHDIQSPLTALEVAAFAAKKLPEVERNLIRGASQRIRDIVNILMARADSFELKMATLDGKDAQSDETSGSMVENNLSTEWISGVLDSIVSEKRTQYRTYKNVKINFDLDSFSENTFALINKVEFKRVISNIVNNSVEAAKELDLLVRVTIQNTSSFIRIEVMDNGIGIDSEILNKVTNENFSSGKKTGTGLGLSHAKKAIESWNGKLLIESIKNEGTKVSILIPRIEAPKWFPLVLDLNCIKRVCVFDDDNSVHQIWNSRLGALGLEVVSFYKYENLKNYLNQLSRTEIEETKFLIDYEYNFGDFNNNTPDGIAVINMLNLSQHSILVTSHYENNTVIEDAIKSNIFVLPKLLAPYIKVSNSVGWREVSSRIL